MVHAPWLHISHKRSTAQLPGTHSGLLPTVDLGVICDFLYQMTRLLGAKLRIKKEKERGGERRKEERRGKKERKGERFSFKETKETRSCI